jgi:hypothetical protein
MKNEEIKNELKRLMEENGGVLLPQSVVDAARDDESPLHDQFEWDNSKAAEAHRLHQARMLIRCTVVFEERTQTNIKAFVSLSTDRTTGGYRETVAVMRHKDMREIALQDALDELERVQTKYGHIKELASVFKAVKRVHASMSKKSKKVA